MLYSNRYSILHENNEPIKTHKSPPININFNNNNNNHNYSNKWKCIASQLPSYINNARATNDLQKRVQQSVYNRNHDNANAHIKNSKTSKTNTYINDGEEEDKNWHKQYYDELGLDNDFDNLKEENYNEYDIYNNSDDY